MHRNHINDENSCSATHGRQLTAVLAERLRKHQNSKFAGLAQKTLGKMRHATGGNARAPICTSSLGIRRYAEG